MMKHRSTLQVLRVLKAFRERFDHGRPLHRAYQEAVRDVAGQLGLTYQTLGDSCRRRLGLASINAFYKLLAHWTEGDPGPLAERLIAASEPAAHDDIRAFFATKPSRGSWQPARGVITDSGPMGERISIELPGAEARMLRALAELDNVAPTELLSRLARTTVRERMRQLARSILDHSGADESTRPDPEDILRRLRQHEAELRRIGVERLSLFGSAARGEADSASDVDLAVQLRPDFSDGGLDHVGRFEALRARLAEILGRPVDLIEEPVETARLQAPIERDRVLAF